MVIEPYHSLAILLDNMLSSNFLEGLGFIIGFDARMRIANFGIMAENQSTD
jgi:hypothetical protein